MPDLLMVLVLDALASLASAPAYFPDSREILRDARGTIRAALWHGDPVLIRRAAEDALEAVEMVAEREAEGAWLKSAESYGWEDNLQEERETGCRVT